LSALRSRTRTRTWTRTRTRDAARLAAELARPPSRRDAAPILGGLVLGIGAGVALERAAMLGENHRPDPEAGEPFGMLPGTKHRVTSWDGTELHVEERGEGPCLIFAHGFALAGSAWHYQRRDLHERFRCVFVDTRGHGASGRSASGDYSLEAVARDLAAVIEWTGERQVILVAHSMSGMAALKLAELDPGFFHDRLAGLALVSTSYADTLRGMASALATRSAAKVQLAIYTAAYRFVGADPHRAHGLRRRGSDMGYLTTRLGGFGPRPSPKQVAFTDQLLIGTDVEVWSQVFTGLLDFDMSHVLETLSVPALVVTGDTDRLFPLTAAEHMAATIPDARLLVLPDTGHMAFMEKHEQLDAELTAFADRVMARVDR
jgi:pimeloyl-ACP methyl ester carboxylesterase